MKIRTRSGFSMVELLTVVVLASFLIMAIYQVLITNSRTYAVNNAQIQGQQTLRAGMDVLFGELREISSQGGDLLSMDDNTFTIRAQRAFGLVCTANYAVSPPQLTLFRIGPAFQAGDSVFIYHDNNPETALDDEWFGGIVSAVDTTASCMGGPGQTITVPFVGTTAAATPPDSVRVGAPVRAFDIFTYGEYMISGDPYLGRSKRGGTGADPLVGPLLESGGVLFRYLDSLGTETKVDSLVSQIEVTLRYSSEIRDFQNRLVSDSLLVRVYPRN